MSILNILVLILMIRPYLRKRYPYYSTPRRGVIKPSRRRRYIRGDDNDVEGGGIRCGGGGGNFK